jgi:hypothetical protein
MEFIIGSIIALAYWFGGIITNYFELKKEISMWLFFPNLVWPIFLVVHSVEWLSRKRVCEK